MVESGKTQDRRETTRSYKDQDGVTHTEQIIKDTKTGETISHNVDGVPIKKKEAQGLNYHPGNGEQCIMVMLDAMVHSLNRINKQLLEMNYYMAKTMGDDSDRKRVEAVFSKNGRSK